jgi:hypothetical protein
MAYPAAFRWDRFGALVGEPKRSDAGRATDPVKADTQQEEVDAPCLPPERAGSGFWPLRVRDPTS